MTRKPAFLDRPGALSIASAVFAWRYFWARFRSSRSISGWTAAQRSRRCTRSPPSGGVGPADARRAASFSLDESVQTFVELEGGGKPAFAALVADPLYSPYRWQVRHFRERARRTRPTFDLRRRRTPKWLRRAPAGGSRRRRAGCAGARAIAESALDRRVARRPHAVSRGRAVERSTHRRPRRPYVRLRARRSHARRRTLPAAPGRQRRHADRARLLHQDS